MTEERVKRPTTTPTTYLKLDAVSPTQQDTFDGSTRSPRMMLPNGRRTTCVVIEPGSDAWVNDEGTMITLPSPMSGVSHTVVTDATGNTLIHGRDSYNTTPTPGPYMASQNFEVGIYDIDMVSMHQGVGGGPEGTFASMITAFASASSASGSTDMQSILSFSSGDRTCACDGIDVSQNSIAATVDDPATGFKHDMVGGNVRDWPPGIMFNAGSGFPPPPSMEELDELERGVEQEAQELHNKMRRDADKDMELYLELVARGYSDEEIKEQLMFRSKVIDYHTKIRKIDDAHPNRFGTATEKDLNGIGWGKTTIKEEGKTKVGGQWRASVKQTIHASWRPPSEGDGSASDAIDRLLGSDLLMDCEDAVVLAALLAWRDVLGKEVFDEIYKGGIILDINPDGAEGLGALKGIGIRSSGKNGLGITIAPGDFVYHPNDPSYSDPENDNAWRGECTLYEGNGLFGGHGFSDAMTRKAIEEELARNYRGKKNAPTVPPERDPHEIEKPE